MNRPSGIGIVKHQASDGIRLDLIGIHCVHDAASPLCLEMDGSGVDLERQVKLHHRLALVILPLKLDAPLDGRCAYTLTHSGKGNIQGFETQF